MANEYLIKKWRLWFKCIDRKHAGQLTKEDEKRDEEALVKLAHLEGERKAEALQTSQNLWNQLVFHGKAGPVTEDEFVEMTNNDFKEDRKKFEANMRKACVDDIKIFSQIGEDSVTEEEFTNAYKSMGFKDEAWIKKFFEAFDPVDGKALNESLVEGWVQFLVNEDSSKKDAVLESLESYPDL